MKTGTTANLVDFYNEVGEAEFNNFIEDKINCLEELTDIGFNEAIPALKALINTHQWVIEINKIKSSN